MAFSVAVVAELRFLTVNWESHREPKVAGQAALYLWNTVFALPFERLVSPFSLRVYPASSSTAS